MQGPNKPLTAQYNDVRAGELGIIEQPRQLLPKVKMKAERVRPDDDDGEEIIAQRFPESKIYHAQRVRPGENDGKDIEDSPKDAAKEIPKKNNGCCVIL